MGADPEDVGGREGEYLIQHPRHEVCDLTRGRRGHSRLAIRTATECEKEGQNRDHSVLGAVAKFHRGARGRTMLPIAP